MTNFHRKNDIQYYFCKLVSLFLIIYLVVQIYNNSDIGFTRGGFIVLLLCLLNNELFSKLEFGTSVKIELREKIKEADETLKLMREQAIANAEAMIPLISFAGIMSHISKIEKHDLYYKQLDILRRIGIEENIIKNLDEKSPLHSINIAQYVFRVLSLIKSIHKPSNQDMMNKVSAMMRQADLRSGEIVQPDDLKKLLSETGQLNDEANELIEDYEFYIKNKKHRRIEIFIGSME